MANEVTNRSQVNRAPVLETSPLAICSLVFGIVSLVLFIVIMSIPAIICGHIARSQIKKSPQSLTGSGIALAGLIMGYTSLGLTIAGLLLFFLIMFVIGISSV